MIVELLINIKYVYNIILIIQNHLIINNNAKLIIYILPLYNSYSNSMQQAESCFS